MQSGGRRATERERENERRGAGYRFIIERELVRGRFSKLPRGAHRVRARERGGGGETTGAPSAGRFSLHSTVAERRVRIAPPHRIRRLARVHALAPRTLPQTPPHSHRTAPPLKWQRRPSCPDFSPQVGHSKFAFLRTPKNLFALDSDHFLSWVRVFCIYLYKCVCACCCQCVYFGVRAVSRDLHRRRPGGAICTVSQFVNRGPRCVCIIHAD
jgi:hypothetical protein